MTIRVLLLIAVLLAVRPPDAAFACEIVAQPPISRPAGATFFVAKATKATDRSDATVEVRAELLAGKTGDEDMPTGPVVLVPWSIDSDCSPIAWSLVRDRGLWSPPESPAFYVGWLRPRHHWIDGLPTIDIHMASRQPMWQVDSADQTNRVDSRLTPLDFLSLYAALPTDQELRARQAEAPETAEILEERAVRAAKQTRIHVLDTALPPVVTLDAWLREFVGAAEISWDVNDCGEQTGNPDIDKERDIPLCVEARTRLDEQRVLSISILVGTSRNGVTGVPAFYSAHLSVGGNPRTWFRRLSEIRPSEWAPNR